METDRLNAVGRGAKADVEGRGPSGCVCRGDPVNSGTVEHDEEVLACPPGREFGGHRTQRRRTAPLLDGRRPDGRLR